MPARRFSANFWLYLSSRFFSATAMTMMRAAIAWHVFDLSHSAFHLGLIGLVQFLPVPTLMLIGGALADTHDRRRIMMTAQALPLTASLLLVAADHHGGIVLPYLYGMVLAAGVSWSFDSPSRAALLPNLVAREVLPRAVTIASTNQAIAFTTGPAVAGLIIARFGVGSVYAIYGGLMALAMLALALLHPPAQERGRNALNLAGIREGITFVWRHQEVLGCMTLDLLAVIFGGATAMLPIYAKDILHAGKVGYGILASSLEAGALVMALILTLLPPIRRAGRALLITVTVYGVATVLFGLSRWFPFSVLAYMLVGMADQVSVVLRSTIVQLATPDALRGRVSGVNMIFIGASNQLGAAESGFVAAATSPTFSVVSGGVASLLVVALVAARLPRLRRYRIDKAPPL